MKTLGLFVKHPVPGQVKTRLAAALGNELATQLYRAFLTDLTHRLRNFPANRSLGYSPDHSAARSFFQEIAGDDYNLWPQTTADLGRRMFAFFEDHLQAAGDRAVLIGSDSPSLPTEILHAAFDGLERSDIVLGPAADGGYYLIGMNYPVKDIFAGIIWSAPTVLQHTADRIVSLNQTVSLLPIWYDVDSPQDLATLRGHLAAMTAAKKDHGCPATMALLEPARGESQGLHAAR